MNLLLRILFLAITPLLCASVHAQSLSIVDSFGNDLTNDTIYVIASVSDYDIQVPAGVHNSSGDNLSVNVTRIEEDVLPNTSSFFCWGSCTGVITSGQLLVLTPTGSVAMTAGETVPGNGDGFLFHYDPNSQIGTSLFKFVFFDISDTLDNAIVYISITTNQDDVSVQQQKSELFSLYPNPTNGQITLQMDEQAIGARVRVIDMLGQEVGSYAVTGTKMTLDLQQEAGVYFIEFRTLDGRVFGRKVVKH